MAPFTTKIQKNMFLLGPFIEDLPENVMVDILSRLPVKTIIHCKCVCNKWRNIVSDSYFANLHLLRSPAGLVILDRSIYDYYPKPGILKWVEVEDELDHHHLHHDPVMSLDLNFAPIFQRSLLHPVGSVNGLIFLRKFGGESDNTYICNPITREYMILPKKRLHRDNNATTVYGFGVGSLTREYKVIRILKREGHPDRTSTSEADVYTVGTGKWRRLGHVPYRPKDICGLFLNGHAHWTVGDRERICAFDFDTETFDWFPSPPSATFIEISQLDLQSLMVVKGCLSRCDAVDSEFVIWVMKEYGIKKSWHKEVVIKPSMIHDIDWSMWEDTELLEILKDGTILMVSDQTELMAYCPRKKTFVDIEMFDSNISGVCYRPSFLKLQDLESERVYVF